MNGHPITGIDTSTTLLIGDASHGPLGVATHVRGAADVSIHFGAADAVGHLVRAANFCFANGATDAWMLRLAATRAIAASATTDTLRIEAIAPGAAGNRLRVAIVKARGRSTRFRIDVRVGGTRSTVVEHFDDLSLDSADARFAPTIVASTSTRIRITALAPAMIATRSGPFSPAARKARRSTTVPLHSSLPCVPPSPMAARSPASTCNCSACPVSSTRQRRPSSPRNASRAARSTSPTCRPMRRSPRSGRDSTRRPSRPAPTTRRSTRRGS